MRQKRYIFECITDETLQMPVGAESQYEAVQALKKLVNKVSNWKLVKIIETTFCDRSISVIERYSKAMRPKK